MPPDLHHGGNHPPVPDPGDLWHRLDDSARFLIRADHVALTGEPHLTPDALERAEADLIPVARWQGGNL